VPTFNRRSFFFKPAISVQSLSFFDFSSMMMCDRDDDGGDDGDDDDVIRNDKCVASMMLMLYASYRIMLVPPTLLAGQNSDCSRRLSQCHRTRERPAVSTQNSRFPQSTENTALSRQQRRFR
jgi:hypothetical protein